MFYHNANSIQQPVGFVTFNTRAGAEAAKQDLQVKSNIIDKWVIHQTYTLTHQL
jgi:hypothetical protein